MDHRPGVVEAYPLSVLQTGMVFHLELDPDNLPYHNVTSCHVRAPFDAELFRQAAQDVVDRHPVLRTSFDFGGHPEPMQLVHAAAALPVEIQDLRAVSEDKAQQVLRELLDQERRRPFDIGSPPLLRLFLHRRTDDTFQWTLTEHHAILDGRGRATFQAEVFRRYLRLLRDPQAQTDPAPALSFRDFVALERETAASEDEQRYWTATLAGYEPVTLPRWPAGDTPSAGADGSLESLLPEELAERLRSLAALVGVPLETVLLAAHLKVIGAATGRHDVVTGLTVDGRQEGRADAEEVCGMFLNVPPLRVDLVGGTWGELVRRVHAAEQELRRHGRYPLASIQWALGDVELFDNTFEYQRFPVPADGVDGVPEFVGGRLRSAAHLRAEPTSYPLATAFLHDPRTPGLLLRLDYHPATVARPQAEAIRDSYLAVLAAMTDVDARHEHFSPLTEAEHRRLIVEWNGPARPYPVDRCVHELIEEQVRRTPGNLAVTDGEVELSYAELNRRANRLARHLREQGAGEEKVVAVVARRDAELAVMLLAILKSGAAYLPLEPQYPAERLRYMLEDSGADLVLAESQVVPRVPGGRWTVLDAAQAVRDSAALPEEDLGRTSSPDNLMYIVYTSGSTGRPKGVLVPHFGVVNYLGWCVEGYASRGTGGAPVFSSIAFDMIVPNLYTPLIIGERLCMLGDAADSVELADRLDAMAPFNFIKLTPGHLDLLDQLLEPERARQLAATLAVGADAFPTRILDSWRSKNPDSVMLNEYGPTEASVGNTVYFPDGPIATDQVPIGRAIPNTTMYVLDHAMNPVPLGVTGELYIGGDCVVRGYANRPRLTAERFVPDPFGTKPGARMYRTGDLGRWLPEGALEFLGRDDDQLKVNGYRVELGEIEVVLVEHPAIKQSVAAVLGRERGEARLVGYYMADRHIPDQELRAHLAERLPAYMVPTTLMAIDTLPLNANGKVDRKALPDPGGFEPAGAGEYQPPMGAPEKIIAAAWEDLLYLDRAGRDDNFVALGGNSLLAVELAFRLRRQGIEVRLSDVLRPAALAELAASAGRSDSDREDGS